MKTTTPLPGTLETNAELLRAMSHPLRLRMLQGLSQCECNVGKLWHTLGISQPLASQHLNRMRRAGLIVGKRKGQEICYRLADPRIAKILKLLES
ncbi:MAG: helix-turn-helix transcriptional regulator [Candidatus Firestonebacteria bacterium]|nr:helix-turn-helix transcriptional regulator [Candidatus Firestonebacteria bacterium]